MGSDNPIAETTRRILTDLADPQPINKAGDGWKAPAWSALEQAGLTLAWVPEDLGGSGADLADGFAVLREAGRFALAVPLAETLLAGWLLARAGIPAPKGAMTCAPARDGDRVTLAANGTLSGALRSVPFAKDAKHLAVARAPRRRRLAVALVEASQARIAEGTSIGGDPLNAVRLEGARPVAVKDAPAGLDEQALLLMGAAVRAMQMAGALEAILDLSVAYANERVAFERPIAKFQAVQHNLARLAGETAVAIAAASSAAGPIANASPSPLWGGVRGGGHRRSRPNPSSVTGEGRRACSSRPPRPRSASARPPPRARHRPPGARRHRLHPGAHAAPFHAPPVGLARRLRQRERLGGEARQPGRGQGRRRTVAHAGGAVRRDPWQPS